MSDTSITEEHVDCVLHSPQLHDHLSVSKSMSFNDKSIVNLLSADERSTVTQLDHNSITPERLRSYITQQIYEEYVMKDEEEKLKQNACPLQAEIVNETNTESNDHYDVTILRIYVDATLIQIPRVLAWSHLLNVREEDIHRIEKQLQEDHEVDDHHQRIIQNDVGRTRPYLKFFQLASTHRQMENLLKYTCRTCNISYKQGLNEVLAPFCVLSRQPISVGLSMATFMLFFTKYLVYLHADSFQELQKTFLLFNHLLGYHNPYLNYYLNHYQISPQLYVTPWFFTLFASKLELDILMAFWDYYIAKDDPLFFYFIGLALLLHNRDIVLNTEICCLPETLVSLSIRDMAELRLILHHATLLREETPFQFYTTTTYNIPQTSPSFSMNQERLLSSTLYFISAQDVFVRYLVRFSQSTSEWSTRKSVLLDCRHASDYALGHLPVTMLVDINDANWKGKLIRFLSIMVCDITNPAHRLSLHSNTILYEKCTIHILLMGSGIKDTTETSNVFRFLVYECFLPRVSVILGGYPHIHDLSTGYHVELVDHNTATCRLCCGSRRSSLEDNEVENVCHSVRSKSFFRTVYEKSLDIQTKIVDNLWMFDSERTSKKWPEKNELDVNDAISERRKKIQIILKLLRAKKHHIVVEYCNKAPQFFNERFLLLVNQSIQNNQRILANEFLEIPLSSMASSKKKVFLCFIKLIPFKGYIEQGESWPHTACYVTPTEKLCQLIISPTYVSLTSRLFQKTKEETNENATASINKQEREHPESNTADSHPCKTSTGDYAIQYLTAPLKELQALVSLEKKKNMWIFVFVPKRPTTPYVAVVAFLNRAIPGRVSFTVREPQINNILFDVEPYGRLQKREENIEVLELCTYPQWCFPSIVNLYMNTTEDFYYFGLQLDGDLWC